MMELCDETLGKNSLSKEGFDSNAEILPAKKNNKRTKQMNHKAEAKKKQNLSKTQKRKLKKLEEENEKALLYSKSIEMLEKYKLSGDAYSLLRSSKSIGKAETMLEKRRRAIQFSKAGLNVPHKDESLKHNGELSCTTEHQGHYTTDHGQVQPIVSEQEILDTTSSSVHFSRQLVDADELGSTGAIGAPENFKGTPAGEDAGDSPPKLPSKDYGESSNRMDGVDGSEDIDATRNSNLPGSSLQRLCVTPCVVHVSRPNEVEEQRKDLPIVMMEQEIMEAINYHSTVIICGETGCGKTTQVPQFLHEAGFGSQRFSARGGIIGVTQPRKVAVLATAKRVAFELGVRLGKEVGFQVRHDKKIGENSSIKFMTDGILLREVQNDMLLRRYSVVILDEAHERSLNTDILIGMLSRVIRVRQVNKKPTPMAEPFHNLVDLLVPLTTSLSRLYVALNLCQHYYEQQQKVLRSGQSISPEDIIFPMKLVLMSATLRVEDFTASRKLFNKQPPVINIPTRQFKVTVHFSKKTEIVDYLGQAYKKVISIHKNLPQGGILVFVTGQREVEFLCRKLRKASRDMIARSSKRDATSEVFNHNAPETSSLRGVDVKEINEAFDESFHPENDRFHSCEADLSEIDDDDDDGSDDFHASSSESEWEIIDENDNDNENVVDLLGKNGSLASLKAAFEALAGKSGHNPNYDGKQDSCVTKEVTSGQPVLASEESREDHKDKGPSVGALCVLPLYAMLPAVAQFRVFEEVKEGERLVVVATNVAETSLTIPGIKYVVDTGREKVKNYNPSNGIETYEVQWISKASAAQRAGRAGRTGPGHCYRLYSSAVFNNIFPDFSCAEISKVPVDGVVLLMKSMCISKVANFPFPTSPEASALVEADRCLKALEALDADGNLTSLGKAMAYYPMSPRHSRMLLTVIQIMRQVKNYSRANLILGYAIATAAALSLSNPFIMRFEGNHTAKDDLDNDEIMEEQDKQQKKKLKEKIKEARNTFSNPSSDALTVAYALQCFELSKSQMVFCEENGLHLKTMEEMSKLRKQLLQLVFNRNRNSDVEQDFSWPHGNLQDVENSWQASLDKIRLLQNEGLNEEEILGQAIYAGWADRVARKTNAKKYQSCMVQETVFLHRWSSLSNSAPEFLVYSELLRTKRPYMHGATRVKPEWLVKYARSLCTFSSPLEDPKPFYEAKEDQVYHWVSPSFGTHLWQLPLHNVPITDDLRRVAVFASCLLEGEVLPCLRAVRSFMAAKPETILRPEALGHTRVGGLLKEMKEKKIDSCSSLRKEWDRNPEALYSEVLVWFQKKFHDRFRVLWLEMLREAKLGPRERFPKRLKRGKHRV